MEAKPINYPLYFKSIKNKNDSDQLQHRVEELASIAAITHEVTSKLSMKQMIASTHKQIHAKVIFNVKELVLPYLEKLRAGKLSAQQKNYISVLESNLTEIISPFVHKLSSSYYNLTPKEIQVADLIKKGKTTKEIAHLLKSSTRVIDFHRNNLRKKFGLINKKTNLRSYLLTLS